MTQKLLLTVPLIQVPLRLRLPDKRDWDTSGFKDIHGDLYSTLLDNRHCM